VTDETDLADTQDDAGIALRQGPAHLLVLPTSGRRRTSLRWLRPTVAICRWPACAGDVHGAGATAST
jgi:hypothetical protein